MSRTDFTQEIDGALAGRNLGQRHYSEIARSGNGNMRTDLAEDLADYQELAGLGEQVEELSGAESALIDQQGATGAAKVQTLVWPKSGQIPPFASNPGMVWLRKRNITGARKPGGNRLARSTWVQVSKLRLQELRQSGAMNGMGAFDIAGMGMPTILAIGAALGFAAYKFSAKKR